MATDFAIDPITLDYIDDGAGGFEIIETAATALHHQIHIERGTWWGDPRVGGRLPTLNRAKSSLQTPAIIADMFRELAKPLVDAGRITEPVVSLTRNLDRIEGDVTVVDTKTEDQIALSDLLPLNP